MAKTYLQAGNNIDYTNGGASVIASGAMVRVGAMLGIALFSIAVGETGTLALIGVWELPKVSATAVAAGDMLDYTALTGLMDVGITAVAGDLTMAATAWAPAGAGDATVQALLLPGRGTAT